jgi:hypothetical protein
MSENMGGVLIVLLIVVLIIFTAGDPDLLDAIINWIERQP